MTGFSLSSSPSFRSGRLCATPCFAVSQLPKSQWSGVVTKRVTQPGMVQQEARLDTRPASKPATSVNVNKATYVQASPSFTPIPTGTAQPGTAEPANPQFQPCGRDVNGYANGAVTGLPLPSGPRVSHIHWHHGEILVINSILSACSNSSTMPGPSAHEGRPCSISRNGL